MKLIPLILATLYTVSMNFSTIYADQTKFNSPQNIISNSVILIDAQSGLELYSKNAHSQDYPASITKVMTALLAIEFAGDNYSDTIYFEDSSVFGIPRHSNHIAMDVGDTLPLSEALLAILLESANEVSIAVAEYVSGSEVEFAKLMTARAKELGALSTNFTNATGLPDPNHYTTAYDMAQILREAIKHDKFIELITTKSHMIPPTERQPEHRPLNNSHRMIQNGGTYFYDGVVGGKTGYTIEAQHTLVTYATRDNIELIAVILRGEKNSPYTDSRQLFDYGFSLYDNMFSFDKNNFAKSVPIYQSGTEQETPVGNATVIPQRNFNKLIPHFIELAKIKTEAVLPDKIYDNVNIADVVGQLNFNYDGVTLESINLLVSDATIVLSASQDESMSNPIEESDTQSFAINPIWLIISAILLSVVAFITFQYFRGRRMSRRFKINYRSPRR